MSYPCLSTICTIFNCSFSFMYGATCKSQYSQGIGVLPLKLTKNIETATINATMTTEITITLFERLLRVVQ